MLKVFPWGAPGKVSQLRGPLGGAPGNPGKLWGAVWFWANTKSSPETVFNKFFFKACGSTMPKLFFGGSPTTLKTNFPSSDRGGNQRATSCLQLMSKAHVLAI